MGSNREMSGTTPGPAEDGDGPDQTDTDVTRLRPTQPRFVGVARIPRARGAAAVTAASRQAVGVARIPEPTHQTRPFVADDVPAKPIFSDDSGRRRRMVTVVAFLIAVMGLLLVAALWLSQTALPATAAAALPATAAAARTCPASAGCATSIRAADR
jgi:hypothetical protein